jgi:myo-inositol-1-phosphate synthase
MLKMMLDASNSSIFLKDDILNMIDRIEGQEVKDSETLADRYPNLFEQVEVRKFTREELNSAITKAIDNLRIDFLHEMNAVAEYDIDDRQISIDLPDDIFEDFADNITDEIFENV